MDLTNSLTYYFVPVSWCLGSCRMPSPFFSHVYFSAILELDPHMQKTLVSFVSLCLVAVCEWPMNNYSRVMLVLRRL
jgi:hypothetical protein